MQLDFCRLSKFTHVEMLNVARQQVIRRSNAWKKCLPWIALKQIKLNLIESFDHLLVAHSAIPKVLTFKNHPLATQPQSTINKCSPQFILLSKLKLETRPMCKILESIF